VKAVAKMQTGTSFRMQYETRWCAVSQKKTTLTYVTNWWYRPTSVKKLSYVCYEYCKLDSVNFVRLV